MAKSQKRAQNPLLAQVPRRGQAYIATIMAERDGNLPLGEFLAKRWDVEGHWRSMGRSDDEVARFRADQISSAARQYPAWTTEQIRTAVSLLSLQADLKEASIARRFALEDPSELARGLAVMNRLRWLSLLLQTYPSTDFDALLDAAAVRDLTVAERIVNGRPFRNTQDPDDFDVCSLAFDALVRKDFGTL